MSKFKDQVFNDINNVFFEVEERDEFTTVHEVDGVSYTQVIVDKLEQVDRKKRLQKNIYKYGDGMWLKELLFYIPQHIYGKPLPSIGRAMTFDGKRYIVTDAVNEDGVYSISLEANAN